MTGTAEALRRIEADLAHIAAETTPDHAPDSFELNTLARRIGAQAEMIEQGLVEC